MKVEQIGHLEEFSRAGWIDLYYGDESRVNLEANVPYGWQFIDEDVFMPVEKGGGLNLFGMTGRNNELIYETTTDKITSQFILEQLEIFSMRLKNLTVVVLDNASVHTAGIIKQRTESVANERIIYFLFTEEFAAFKYCRDFMAKAEIRMAFVIRLCDKQQLHYSVRQILGAVERILRIRHLSRIKANEIGDNP